MRRLIFKGKNNWNGLCIFSDQYFYPPTVDREGEEWRRIIIIIFAVYRFRNAGRQPISIVPALVLNSISVPREQSGFGKEARYLTCYRQVSLYWPIFNAIITELFIRPAPFWCTSFPTRTPAWISLSFFLYVSLMCSTSRVTQLFPKIWTSNLCLYFPPCGPGHMCTRFLMAQAFIYAAQDSQRVHIFAPKHTLASVFPLPTPFHSAHGPMLTYRIHF